MGLWGSGGALTPALVLREWGRPGPDPAALPGEGLGGQPIPSGYRAGEWGAPERGAEGWGCRGGGADAVGPHSAWPCWAQGDVAALEGGESLSRPCLTMGGLSRIPGSLPLRSGQRLFPPPVGRVLSSGRQGTWVAEPTAGPGLRPLEGWGQQALTGGPPSLPVLPAQRVAAVS